MAQASIANSSSLPSINTARDSRSAHTLAKGLGWLSIGLGLAELLAPRAMARATGLDGREDLVRAYGLREIASGIGILSSDDPAPWVWARAGGDALDLATLGTRVGNGHGAPIEKVGAALAAVAGVAMVDLACARGLSRENKRREDYIAEYRQRSGFSRPPEEMRGAARADFEMPADMRTPEPLQPYDASRQGGGAETPEPPGTHLTM